MIDYTDPRRVAAWVLGELTRGSLSPDEARAVIRGAALPVHCAPLKAAIQAALTHYLADTTPGAEVLPFRRRAPPADPTPNGGSAAAPAVGPGCALDPESATARLERQCAERRAANAALRRALKSGWSQGRW